jgi:hypothetical protein
MQVSINAYRQSLNNISSEDLGVLFINSEIPIGVINNSNAIFTSINPFVPESVELYINGLKQLPVDEYITTGGNTITLLTSPQTTDVLTINYIKI